MKKYFISLLLALLFIGSVKANDKTVIDSLKSEIFSLSNKFNSQSLVLDSLRNKASNNIITFDIKDWDKKKDVFKKSDNWFIYIAPAIVGILALLFSIITTKMINKANKENTILQIAGAKESEKDKFKRENDIKQKELLKDLVAKFIKKSLILNKKYDEILLYTLPNNEPQIVYQEYNKTIKERDEIEDLYYSILVSLNYSKEHSDLNKKLNKYMENSIWIKDIIHVKPEQYMNPIRDIYPIIKSIVHPNNS